MKRLDGWTGLLPIVRWFGTRFWRSWVLVLVLGLVSQIFAVALPYMMKVLIDSIVDGNLEHLRWLGRWVLVVFSLSAAANYLHQHRSTLLVESTTQALRGELFSRIQNASPAVIARFRSGDVLSRLTTDAWTLQLLLTRTPLELLTSTVVMLVVLVIQLSLDTRLGMLVVAVVPVYLALSVTCGSRVRQAAARSLEQLGMIR